MKRPITLRQWRSDYELKRLGQFLSSCYRIADRRYKWWNEHREDCFKSLLTAFKKD